MTICRRFFASACLLVSLGDSLLTESFTLTFPYGKSSSRMRYTPFANTLTVTLTCRTQWADDSDRDSSSESESATGDNDDRAVDSFQRRGIMLALTATLLPSSPSYAGEVGARINAAVTKSELGVAVRESVVRGAQVMDKLDGQWEQFSDKFGLGSARSQQDKKPAPKVIPNPLPLDTRIAKRLVEITDQTFLSLTGIPPNALSRQMDAVAVKVRPSFERAGMELKQGTAQEFNFISYTHFKAYGDLIIENKIPFPSFRKDFERQVGQELLTLLNVKSTSSDNDNKQAMLEERLRRVDQVCKVLRDKGLVAATERSSLDDDQLADWLEGLTDLTLNVALDGDVTMNAQILLQEQGFRLYPNYAKYMVAQLLEMPKQSVSVDDYYMDTDYNSDPNKFEAKQVMLNIVLESN